MQFISRRWDRNWPELSAALGGGLPGFVFARRPHELGDAVPVFVFHTVARDVLEADLRFLRANAYVTITADALLDHLHGRERAPSRAVVLCFDDGAANLYNVVFPLLRTFRCQAVAFVAPRIHDAARSAHSDGPHPCTWSELLEMHGSGLVDVQSHTFEHRYVPRWPTPVPLTGIARAYLPPVQGALTLEEDFRRSRECLEHRLGRVVRHLAFPRFEGTEEAVRAGQAIGYHGFWWGLQRGRPLNRPGEDGTRIVRLSGEFVRRLPGRHRTPINRILAARYLNAVRGWKRDVIA